jgi:hypothetical protein
VNQRKPATIDNYWVTLGTFDFKAAQPAAVEVDAATADGQVHLDAIQVLSTK